MEILLLVVLEEQEVEEQVEKTIQVQEELLEQQIQVQVEVVELKVVLLVVEEKVLLY
jgi:hypothetical protein